jgi:hypothetical protein
MQTAPVKRQRLWIHLQIIRRGWMHAQEPSINCILALLYAVCIRAFIISIIIYSNVTISVQHQKHYYEADMLV